MDSSSFAIRTVSRTSLRLFEAKEDGMIYQLLGNFEHPTETLYFCYLWRKENRILTSFRKQIFRLHSVSKTSLRWEAITKCPKNTLFLQKQTNVQNIHIYRHRFRFVQKKLFRNQLNKC